MIGYDDLTVADVLKDPLIRQMMRADGVSVKQMKDLLGEAALPYKQEAGLSSAKAGRHRRPCGHKILSAWNNVWSRSPPCA